MPETPKRMAAQAAAQSLTKGMFCESCGEPGFWRPTTRWPQYSLHAHHDDYDEPTVVRWLCAGCHSRWHAANGPGANIGTFPARPPWDGRLRPLIGWATPEACAAIDRAVDRFKEARHGS